jgi:hypothetical protein
MRGNFPSSALFKPLGRTMFCLPSSVSNTCPVSTGKSAAPFHHRAIAKSTDSATEMGFATGSGHASDPVTLPILQITRFMESIG